MSVGTDTDDGAGVVGRAGELSSLGRFCTEEFARLWLIATATYVVGDSVTTLAIVNHSQTVAEGNVAMATAIDAFGEAGLIGLKLVAMLFGIAVSIYATRDHDRMLYYTPPVFLAVVGAFATAYNIRLLIG
ncbi:hypothetical protein [Haloglomus halophilum]|uniref:hypothetical protein n=1 Tax=Haloglomus halophilum TaxID=2962672 RepID=UPI0020C98064|nr:hypothetical protein [Haloglomus halophilum]